MKTITQYITLFTLLFFISNASFGTSYTWTGSTSTSWSVSSNWSPAGVPGSSDNVTIGSTTRQVVLDQNRTITNLTITTDTLFLNGDTLTVNGTLTGTSGKITNGLLKCRGSVTAFNGTLIDAEVDAVGGVVRFSGSTFTKKVSAEANGGSTSTGTGGCTFNDSLKLKLSSNGVYLKMATTSGNTFQGPVIITNTGDHEIMMSDAGTSYYNNNIVVNSTSTGGVVFGNNGGASELASGKTISIGATGFTNNYLTLKNFTQLGSTSQSLTLTSSGVLVLTSCTFNGSLTVSGPGFLLKNNTFNGTSSFSKSGSTSYHSDGGNTFNGFVTFNNTGSAGRIRLSTITADNYYDDASFQSTGQDVQVCYVGTSEFKGNVTINNSHVNFNSNTGTAKFTGTSSQSLNGASLNFAFKNLTIDKSSNHVTANTTLSVDGVLTLTSGNIITTSTNLVTLKAGSSVSGASNSSFIDGPIKKIGNTAFEFPVGKSGYLFPILISSPSINTDAYTAEYKDTTQTLGGGLDASLDEISSCDYWTLSRNSGTSNVYVSLGWENVNCHNLDTIDSRIVSFEGGAWINKGNSDKWQTDGRNFIKTNSLQSNFNAFCLGFINQGSSSQSALNITEGNFCENSTNYSQNPESWIGFYSDSLNLTISVKNINIDTLHYFVDTLELYQGTYNNMRMIARNDSPSALDSLVLIADGIDTSLSNHFLIKIKKSAYNASYTSDSVAFGFCIQQKTQIINPFVAYENICGLNYVTSFSQLNQRPSPVASPSTGSTLPVTLTITAPGAGSQILSAFLYITGVSNTTPNVSGALFSDLTNSADPGFTLIGSNSTGNGTCWMGTNSNFSYTYAFRADVTALVKNINTNYTLTGIPVNTYCDWDGVSLLIIYKDCESNPRKASLYLRDGLNVMGGGASYSSGFNYIPNSTNSYQNDVGFLGVSDVEAANKTFFLFKPGIIPPSVNSSNGNPVQNNFYNISSQFGAVNPPLNNASSFQIKNFSHDCYAVTFAGLFFQEHDAICTVCTCDENINYCQTDIVVGTSATWTASSNPYIGMCNNNILTVGGNLIINAGVTLTLNGITIRFGPYGKIIVKRGTGGSSAGVLIIENHTLLTSITENCMWQGIDIYGYQNQINNNQQGRISIEDSEIDNAHVAIYLGRRNGGPTPASNMGSYTGSKLESCKYNLFNNNAISIEYPFSYTFGDNMIITNNEFRSSKPLSDPIYNYERSIAFIDINRRASHPMTLFYQGISNNLFNVLPIFWPNKTIGIRGFDCRKVPIQNNQFFDMDRGVFLLGGGAGNFVQNGNIFRGNNIGIYNMNNTLNTIKFNIISSGVRYSNIALLNQTSRGTLILSNSISSYDIGILVLRSGNLSTLTTQIWNNIINTTSFSLDAGGNNVNTSWLCNQLNGYSSGQAFSIYDYYSLGKIKEQGSCNGIQDVPAGNQFLMVSPDPTLDIRNNYSSTPSNFIYNTSAIPNPIYNPDVISSNISINNCISSIAEDVFCNGLHVVTNINESLNELDSLIDQNQINSLTTEIIRYYFDNNLVDSLTDFLNTIPDSLSFPVLFTVYNLENKIDSLQNLLSRWPLLTDDDRHLVDFFDNYCDIYNDTLSIYELDSLSKAFIYSYLDSDDEAGELARSYDYLLRSIPLEINCEMTNNCESSRIMSLNNLKNEDKSQLNLGLFPNPTSDHIFINIPSEIIESIYFEVFDVLGSLKFRNNYLDYKNLKIKLPFLSDGVYTYRISTNTRILKCGKLTIVH